MQKKGKIIFSFLELQYFQNLGEENDFQVWLRLLSAGLEPVISHSKKPFIATHYREFSTHEY